MTYIRFMKRIALICLLAAMPALAQETAPEGPEPGAPEPFSRGVDRFLRDLFTEMEPTLRELRGIIGKLDDYEAPEILPNGDIIMRRKEPNAPAPEETPREGEVIDL